MRGSATFSATPRRERGGGCEGRPRRAAIGRDASCGWFCPTRRSRAGTVKSRRKRTGSPCVTLDRPSGTFVGEAAASSRRCGCATAASSLSAPSRSPASSVTNGRSRKAHGSRRNCGEAVEYVRAILPEPVTTGPVQAEWWYVPSSELGGDAFGARVPRRDLALGVPDRRHRPWDRRGHARGECRQCPAPAGAAGRRLPSTGRGRRRAGRDVSDGTTRRDVGALWYFVYDLSTRMLHDTAPPGTTPPTWSGPDDPEPAPLWVRAPSIRMMPDRARSSAETRVAPGRRLYVFSDGAFGVVDAAGEQWRIENLHQIIASGAAVGVGEAQRLYRGRPRGVPARSPGRRLLGPGAPLRLSDAKLPACA